MISSRCFAEICSSHLHGENFNEKILQRQPTAKPKKRFAQITTSEQKPCLPSSCTAIKFCQTNCSETVAFHVVKAYGGVVANSIVS